MNHNCILGRDFFKVSKMKMVKTQDNMINEIENNNVQFLSNDNDEDDNNDEDNDIRYNNEYMQSIMNIDLEKINVSTSLNINSNLSAKVKNVIESLISEAFFSNNFKSPINKNNKNVKLSIKLTKTEPFSCPPRRLPFSHKVELK